jgi:hypothetical protein
VNLGKLWTWTYGVLIRQTGKLDWGYIQRQLRPLVELKGEPGISDELDRRRIEAERDSPPIQG